MELPSFIVLGAVKAGTTSLYNYLGQHPMIQMSSWNWPRYFHVAEGPPDFEALAAHYGTALRAESEQRFTLMCPPRIPRSVEQYAALWPPTESNLVRGEVSPTYLHDAEVCTRISRRLPAAKLLMVLRNPIDRAYSHYVMDRRRGWEEVPDFGAALAREPVGADSFWWGRRHYARHGLYANSVKRYLKTFPKKQTRVMLYEEFSSDPRGFLREIFEFVGVDPDFAIDTSTLYNKGLVKRGTRFSRLLNAKFAGRQLVRRSLSGAMRRMIGDGIERTTHELPMPLDPGIRKELRQVFREDVLVLQSVLDRDLSSWLA